MGAGVCPAQPRAPDRLESRLLGEEEVKWGDLSLLGKDRGHAGISSSETESCPSLPSGTFDAVEKNAAATCS